MVLGFIVVATAAWSATSVTAGDGGLGLAYLYGYQGYPYNAVQPYIPPPPYFAMHPPVYYGQRYTRPYGASPFAAWPQLQPSAAYRPERHTDRWQTITNPYAPCCSSTPAAAVEPAVVAEPVAPVEPLVIDNPFYTEAAGSAARLTRTD
ncbi:MAG: hypothetical protein D6753_10430 [Planctomycetota bacterium]|nr:MAG: hypothetical protein D6753_10430 [Planctomycetota bacterium]